MAVSFQLDDVMFYFGIASGGVVAERFMRRRQTHKVAGSIPGKYECDFFNAICTELFSFVT